jgi:hypothetical protein
MNSHHVVYTRAHACTAVWLLEDRNVEGRGNVFAFCDLNFLITDSLNSEYIMSLSEHLKEFKYY